MVVETSHKAAGTTGTDWPDQNPHQCGLLVKFDSELKYENLFLDFYSRSKSGEGKILFPPEVTKQKIQRIDRTYIML